MQQPEELAVIFVFLLQRGFRMRRFRPWPPMDGILCLGVLIYVNAAICTKSLLTILRPLDKRRMVRLMSLKLLCGFLAFGLLCGSIEYC